MVLSHTINTFLYGSRETSLRDRVRRDCRVCDLISQRLARLKRVRDALLRFPFAAERDERFTFEVQDVLLADHLRRAERTARQNVGELARHVRVVLGSVTSALQQM